MNVKGEITNLKTYIVAIIVSIIAFILLFAGAKLPEHHPTLKALTNSVGSLLFSSVAISAIWELFQKRNFREELLGYVELSENIKSSGLQKVSMRFDELDWREFFSECHEFDLFITYGRSWRGTNEVRLRKLAQTPGSKIRIVLPDYRERHLLKQFATRFNKTEEQIEQYIKEAVMEYSTYFKKETCKLTLKLTKQPPTNGYYRFGTKQIVTLYNYRDEKGDIPVLLINKPGRLYDFFDYEFEHLIKNGTDVP